MLQGLFRNYHEIAIYDLRDFYDFVRFRGHKHTHGGATRWVCELPRGGCPDTCDRPCGILGPRP